MYYLETTKSWFPNPYGHHFDEAITHFWIDGNKQVYQITEVYVDVETHTSIVRITVVL